MSLLPNLHLTRLTQGANIPQPRCFLDTACPPGAFVLLKNTLFPHCLLEYILALKSMKF